MPHRQPRLQAALKRQEERLRLKTWQDNTLLQECLAALGTYEILTPAEAKTLLAALPPLISQAPLRRELPPLRPDGCYSIIWDNADTPILRCTGAAILAHFAEVTAVAFETVLLDSTTNACFRCKN